MFPIAGDKSCEPLSSLKNRRLQSEGRRHIRGSRDFDNPRKREMRRSRLLHHVMTSFTTTKVPSLPKKGGKSFEGEPNKRPSRKNSQELMIGDKRYSGVHRKERKGVGVSFMKRRLMEKKRATEVS